MQDFYNVRQRESDSRLPTSFSPAPAVFLAGALLIVLSVSHDVPARGQKEVHELTASQF